MFADTAEILIRSGKGGDGHVSFRRELYVAAGGPDGGDGGKGGDIIFQVDKGLNTLNDFRHRKKYCAGDGQPGGRRRCHGKDGEDLVIPVPEGTVVREKTSGKVIVDMSGKNMREVILCGGRGGKGNMNYATPTMQVPMYAQPGKPGLSLTVTLELKTIADVGLVGFPNVGKSTFLSRVSNAKPKIANYHFTTLQPILGVVDLDDADGFVIADIPGLIEGASAGLGLGHDFLRHIERTGLFIHMVDAAGTEGRDPIDDIQVINNELKKYDEELSKRPQIIVANKTDVLSEEETDAVIARLKEEFEPQNIPVFAISAVSGRGVKELLYFVRRKLDDMAKEPVVYAREYDLADALGKDEPIRVFYDEKQDLYVVEGPRVERMLGYTNLDSEKGFSFFQKFMEDNGIIEELLALGLKEGDTVCVCDMEFDYME